jgi:uncharacterized coiled-coil DUF342 family protein
MEYEVRKMVFSEDLAQAYSESFETIWNEIDKIKQEIKKLDKEIKELQKEFDRINNDLEYMYKNLIKK